MMDGFESQGASRQLVVFLHGFTSTPATLESLRQAAKLEMPHADTAIPDLHTARLARGDARELTKRITLEINALWDQRLASGGRYDEILLVGHSLGGLLARKLYLCARGACDDIALAPQEKSTAAEWAGAVRRIVLCAGMNRGWRVSYHMGPWRALTYTAGVLAGRVLDRLGLPLLIFEFERGSPFVVLMRLQWLRLVDTPLTIQLLGTVDDMVAPQDCLDLETGAQFVYLEVPKSGHRDVVDVDDPIKGAGRKKNLLAALTEAEGSLRARTLQPFDGSLQVDRKATHVYFILHGIRDFGHWASKIGMRIREMHPHDERDGVRMWTASYGYFPMLPFLLPWRRRQKVHWFMDQLTEARARYPNASFSFVGHSNGTYLLARALSDYPICKFKHVVFAGSVVSRRFDWNGLEQRPCAVLNLVTTHDWVVAIFPKGLQAMGITDLGSGGHDGFVQAPRLTAQASARAGGWGTSFTVGFLATSVLIAGPLAWSGLASAGLVGRGWLIGIAVAYVAVAAWCIVRRICEKPGPSVPWLHELEYLRGSHGTGVTEDYWNLVAAFAVRGSQAANETELAQSRSPAVVLTGIAAPIVWVSLMLLLAAGLLSIALTGGALGAFFALVYLMLLRAILTRL